MVSYAPTLALSQINQFHLLWCPVWAAKPNQAPGTKEREEEEEKRSLIISRPAMRSMCFCDGSRETIDVILGPAVRKMRGRVLR